MTYECVICSKNKPVTIKQNMGSLPTECIRRSAPFNYVGTDYCGPFFIWYKGQRKGTLNVINLVIFICFKTKAVHLELVSELTTDTLKCFIARHGKCAIIFFDNTKNFVGITAELQKMHSLIKCPDETLVNYLKDKRIIRKFIPPYALNFDGLWEARN